MSALYDIIGVATDITDMSITQLTAQSKVCESLVQRVQNIGKAWDEHPDWHGRNWYVQVLLAVASLSRVVEWWEAEKQFWNFDDNEDEQDEPLTFVTKPADEPIPVPTPTFKQPDADLDDFKLNADDENKLRLTRPTSQSRRSRDEHPKDLSLSNAPREPEPHSRGHPKTLENNESARVLATERLRLQAETAQSQNIVIELSIDGDHFIWVNRAWRVVVGLVLYFIPCPCDIITISATTGRNPTDCLELGFHDSSIQQTGGCSATPLTAFRKTTHILSRSGLDFRWSPTMNADRRPGGYSSRWKAKGC